jgi:hypothetical protein
MNYGYAPSNSQTAFLSEDFYLPTDNQDLMIEMIAKREALTASILNVKEIALYDISEILTGQSWFSKRNSTYGQSSVRRIAYRRVFDLVALNGGPILTGSTQISISPIISSITVATKSYGAATIAGPKYVFLPSADISIIFDNSIPTSQKIIITNGLAGSLIQCYYTIEYLK